MQRVCQPSAAQTHPAQFAARRFWLLTPMAATMLSNGRLAPNSSPYSQSQGKRRRTGKACRALRAHPRRHGGIRTGALAGESRRARGSGALVYGRGGTIPPLTMEEQSGSGAGSLKSSGARVGAWRRNNRRKRFLPSGFGGFSRGIFLAAFIRGTKHRFLTGGQRYKCVSSKSSIRKHR